MKRESVNPWEWGLQFGMDQGEIVEGTRRTLHCSGQVAVKPDAKAEMAFPSSPPGRSGDRLSAPWPTSTRS